MNNSTPLPGNSGYIDFQCRDIEKILGIVEAGMLLWNRNVEGAFQYKDTVFADEEFLS